MPQLPRWLSLTIVVFEAWVINHIRLKTTAVITHVPIHTPNKKSREHVYGIYEFIYVSKSGTREWVSYRNSV